MRKLLLSLVVLMTFGFYGFSQNEVVTDVIEKELREEMAVRSSKDLISVNIVMKAQYDQQELHRKSSVYTTKTEKRNFVVNELKSFSAATQSSVMAEIVNLSKAYPVENVKSFWIANVINCEVTKEVIEELALNDDILIIGYNKKERLLFDDETPVPVEGTKGLTQNITQVNADDVWEAGYTGEGVVVAVIDSGVNYNHLDLADHLWDGGSEFPHHGWDFVNNDNDPMDDHGHGTHCSGTVCGDGTAGTQTGMAPNATLMCVKMLDAGGSGTLAQTLSGIQFPVEHGADVLSMSFGWSGGGEESVKISLRNTCINALEAGVVAAVSAGNEGAKLNKYPIPNNVGTPGGCPPPWLHPDQTITGGTSCVVCVGAVDYDDEAAYFTSQGPVTWQSIYGFWDYPYSPGIGLIRPDVSAPGVDIVSLNYSGNTGYTTMSGTSMAAPCVAGIMCLILSKNWDLTPAEVDEILETTGAQLTATKSNLTGSCRVDAMAAVDAIPSGPVKFHYAYVDDSEGNNDHHLNPGETVSLDVCLFNSSSDALGDATVTLSTKSEYVTMINPVAVFSGFGPGDIICVSHAFTFEISEDAIPTKDIIFAFETEIEGQNPSKGTFKLMTYGSAISFDGIVIDDSEGNGNGMLDPGETADIYVYVANDGNKDAPSVYGTLATTYENLTINTNNRFFGNIFSGVTRYAHYNVTMSSGATPNEPIPISIELLDMEGQTYSFDCNIVASCNVVFALHDSYGDGWNGGAALIVNFDDGTPSQSLTIESGNSATYILEINAGTTVSLSWQSGSWDSECSYTISYEGGEQIYSGSGSHSGVFFSWVNNCSLGSGGQILDTPTEMTLTPVTNDIEITWEGPDNVTYGLYRNGQFLANILSDHAYTDHDLEGGEYCYYLEIGYDETSYSEPLEECIFLALEGPYIVIDSFELDGDGIFSYGETSGLSLTIKNVGVDPTGGNVTVTLTTEDPLLTINTPTVVYDPMNPNATQTKDGFAITASSEIENGHKFAINVNAVAGENTWTGLIRVTAYKPVLSFGTFSWDGSYVPGETIELTLTAVNTGGFPVADVEGTLTTTNEYVTVNGATQSFGDIAAKGTASAIYSVTIANDCHLSYIDFSLSLSGDNGDITGEGSFTITNTCNLQFDLVDSYGDGWNGAALLVSFSDGSPSQSYTFSSGHEASFTLEVNSGTTVTLTWQSGNYDDECSFVVSYAASGVEIYSVSDPSAGFLFEFVMDCSAQCAGVKNLTATSGNGGTMEISWTAPIGDVDHYDIYRDDVLIATTTTTSYTDEGLQEGSYVYCVVATFTDYCVGQTACVDGYYFDFIPTSGTIEITTCSGMLYDNGGPNADYSNNCNGIAVIHPGLNGAMVHITGTYVVENNYDKIYIYDGESTSGTLIGTYTSSGSLDVVSTLGALTVKFTSDVSGHYEGFAFTLTCEGGETPGIPGDSNGDGVVNALDIVLVVNYIFGDAGDGFIFDNADINGDGVINALDIVSIINLIFSM
ncbi:MAG: S8 family serine peptidase [Bacteroidales bacterium]|nr:S8 family serine peptidase [Bacteroidales bacterium]